MTGFKGPHLGDMGPPRASWRPLDPPSAATQKATSFINPYVYHSATDNCPGLSKLQVRLTHLGMYTTREVSLRCPLPGLQARSLLDGFHLWVRCLTATTAPGAALRWLDHASPRPGRASTRHPN